VRRSRAISDMKLLRKCRNSTECLCSASRRLRFSLVYCSHPSGVDCLQPLIKETQIQTDLLLLFIVHRHHDDSYKLFNMYILLRNVCVFSAIHRKR
jgi:hypothetical protein